MVNIVVSRLSIPPSLILQSGQGLREPGWLDFILLVQWLLIREGPTPLEDISTGDKLWVLFFFFYSLGDTTEIWWAVNQKELPLC